MNKLITLFLILLVVASPALAQTFSGKFTGYIYLYDFQTNTSLSGPPEGYDSEFISLRVRERGRRILVTDLLSGYRFNLTRKGRALASIVINYPPVLVDNVACYETIEIQMRRLAKSMVILKADVTNCINGGYVNFFYSGTWN